MEAELVGGGIAEELHGVAAFDHGDAFGDRAFQLDRLDLAAILFALHPLLRLLIVVEFALDPGPCVVEDIDDAPGKILKVGFDPRVDQAGDQRVEHLGDGAPGDAIVRQRAMIGFIVIGTMTVKLHFLKEVGGGTGLRVLGLIVMRHQKSPSLSAAPLAAFVATASGGRNGTAPHPRVRPKRSGGWRSGGYFASRCKGPAKGRAGGK